MPQQYPSHIKACATCNYWGGSRKAMQWGDYVELESPMDTGPCYSGDSGWKGSSDVQACSECRYWQKWPALK